MKAGGGNLSGAIVTRMRGGLMCVLWLGDGGGLDDGGGAGGAIQQGTS